MRNPYLKQSPQAFWRHAVAAVAPEDFDPGVNSPFTITMADSVVTAGSCFAQHISNNLLANGFNFLVTEDLAEAEKVDGARAIYSARYGNIYSTLQLRQTFERAYGLRRDKDVKWVRPDGRIVFPTRQQEFTAGFTDPAQMEVEREKHHAAVREAFESCSVFVFTLGLTETWVCDQDGCAVPNAPGVVASPDGDFSYSFKNLSVGETVEHLEFFIRNLRTINPSVKIILTVSPVPLVATFEKTNVVVANTYSKAVLRVAADMASKSFENILYFPSYEMICTLPGADFYETDKRNVRPDAVAHVMEVFKSYLMAEGRPDSEAMPEPVSSVSKGEASRVAIAPREFYGVVCDEEANEQA